MTRERHLGLPPVRPASRVGKRRIRYIEHIQRLLAVLLLLPLLAFAQPLPSQACQAGTRFWVQHSDSRFYGHTIKQDCWLALWRALLQSRGTALPAITRDCKMMSIETVNHSPRDVMQQW